MGDPREVTHQTGFKGATKSFPLSSAACGNRWQLMARQFFDNGFVWVATATQCSSSARIVIADIAIAVSLAASAPGADSDAAPTAGISRAPKEDSITATGNGSTANARNTLA